MSQWAEIRQMHLLEGIPKKEVARRLGVDVKTVRRAVAQPQAPGPRGSVPRAQGLDPFRDRILGWLREEPHLSAKRIGRLLPEEVAATLSERTLRYYVARLRQEVVCPEAFVHRQHPAGETMEVDFGESWAVIAAVKHKVKFLVATLPYSNAYFAKAYAVERLECLLDGIVEAFRWFGGLPRRLVLDNTSLAVKQVLAGADRIEQKLFEAFRGSFPLDVDFCAVGKGCEKGSVERGVRYVRGLGFYPLPQVDSFDALNGQLLHELEHDWDHRHLPDGRTVRQALEEERSQLRPLPAYWPETARVLSRVANKFAHVRLEGVAYSVPIQYAYQPVVVKLFHDRVECFVHDERIATHSRSFEKGQWVLEPQHVLPLLERKTRAVSEATALQPWELPEVFYQLRQALRGRTRQADREWVKVLRLMEHHPLEAVAAAVGEALARGAPSLSTIEMLLRGAHAPLVGPFPPPTLRDDLAQIHIEAPCLSAYDACMEGRL